MARSEKLPLSFLAFVAVAFINAFVDLGHKIVVQNTLFHTTDGQAQVILTGVLNAMILLPFILFFTPASWLSDRFSKPKVMRVAAASAVVVTSLITLCYAAGWFWPAFVLTFVLATQSALYSPAKYGYIRELVGSERLSRANGWVQGATTVAILLGTLAFSFMFEARLDASAGTKGEVLRSLVPLGGLLVLGSILEYFMARQLPDVDPVDPRRWDWGAYLKGQNLRQSISAVWRRQVIWLSIVGLGIFWALCQVLLVVFPAHAEAALGMDNTFHIQALMACSAIGIALGSMLAGRSDSHIEMGYIPLGAVMIALSIGVMPWLSSAWAIGANFFVLGVAGGLYLVPLNSLMQFHAPEGESGRVIASNNLIGNWVMLGFLALSAGLSALGLTATGQIHVLLWAAVGGALYTLYRLPQSILRLLVAWVLGLRYRMRVGGVDNIPAEGGVLLLGNHISFIDWAIVQVACPRAIRFVMHKDFYYKPVLQHVFKAMGAIPIADGDYKKALARVSKALKKGDVVCLFPEGALTSTGNLMTFKRGYEQAVVDTGASIVPFYLNGLWGSEFSRTQRLKQVGVGRRPLQVQFGTPLPDNTQAPAVKTAVMEASIDSWNLRGELQKCLGVEVLASLRRGGSQTALIDPMSGALSARKMGAGVVRMAAWLKRNEPEQRVGLLLPPGAGGVLLNAAAWASGKTVVNLNYSASAATVKAAMSAAGLSRVYTAELFLKRLKEKGFDVEDLRRSVEFVDVAEIRKGFSAISLGLSMAASQLLPARLLGRLLGGDKPGHEPSAILFSSGSEGTPKGVLLSHKALKTNAEQIISVLQPDANERMLGSLPYFHAFGLTATLVMPLLEGIPILTQPDPTDVHSVAKTIEKHRATLLFMTGTLLRLMARNKKVQPQMLQSLRWIIAGAEKLNPAVREAFKERFNKDVLEGYGATEMAPVVAVNLPDYTIAGTNKVIQAHRPGTVGLPIPGTAVRIVDPQSYETLPQGEAGLVLLAGPQQMSAYLDDAERTEQVHVELNGKRWYKSGDKGKLDVDGYLKLIDRYARFAKIGGEMISLGAVEQQLSALIDCEETGVAVVAVQDEQKGERLVALVDKPFEKAELRGQWKEAGYAPLSWPSELIVVDQLPTLGAGKVDYQTCKKRAME
ncbi:MAG: acyl-[ACP]--phospholipid O-acyltransferase [Granulosicoccaceae bacterium]